MKIPKIIHFIWIGNKPLPENHKAYIETWRTNFPDWEIKIWDNDKINKKYYDFITNDSLYTSLKAYSCKTNLLRYKIIEEYGGIYADTDFEVLKDFRSELENLDFFIGMMHEYEKSKIMANGLFGAVPNHRILKDIVKNIEKFAKKRKIEIFKTGPSAMTYFVRKNKLNDNEKIFEVKYFYPYSWKEKFPGYDSPSMKEAYVHHLWTASWRDQLFPKKNS